MIKIITRIVPVLVIVITVPALADNEKLVIVPGVDLNYKTNSLASKAGPTTNKIADANFKTLTPSVAAAYGKWYALASTDFTVEPASFSTYNSLPNGYDYRRSDFVRWESTLNIGYRIYETKTGSINLFGGYHSSRALIDQNIFTYYSIYTPPGAFDNEVLNFDETGPFIGLSYTRPVGNHSLTLSVAYAQLDGTLDDFETDSRTGTPSHGIYYANSRGMSLGLAWNGQMSDNMNYKLGLKYVDYNFDVTSYYDVISGTTTSITPGSLQITNKITSVFIGTTIYL